MKKNWHKQYHPKTPHEINPDTYTSLIEIINESCQKYSDLDAFECLGEFLKFSDIDKLSQNFATFLQKKLNLKQGERIAIQLPNVHASVISIFGALRAGLIVVNTNPLYTAREMRHQFKDSGAKAIVVLENFAHLVEEVLPDTYIENVITVKLSDFQKPLKKHLINFVVKYIKKMVPKYNLPNSISFMDAIKTNDELSFDKPIIKNSDLAFLQYTGGTTGVSKGAMLTHRNILANVEQVKSIYKVLAEDVNQDIVLSPLPIYHIFTLTVNLICFFNLGALNILVTNPRDLKSLIKTMKKFPFTVLTGVNTLFNALNNNKSFKSVSFKQAKFVVAGGMALQNSVAMEWKKITNTDIIQGYGLTETSPLACVNPVHGNFREGTIGIPPPSTDIKILDENEQPVPPGERGEICIKGPQVMKGYWLNTEATEEVMTKDGYFKSGDIGIEDTDGFFSIVDRKKDMILVSGFNVYPNEVEDVVCSNENIIEAAAVGIPSERSGEVVKIFAVRTNQKFTEQDLINYCKDKLTGYKRPKYVEFKKELPKSNVGKILRRELREKQS